MILETKEHVFTHVGCEQNEKEYSGTLNSRRLHVFILEKQAIVMENMHA